MKLCVVTSILRVTHKLLYRAETKIAVHVGRDHRSVGSQLRALAFGFLGFPFFVGLSGCGVHSTATTSAVIGLAASSTSLAPGDSVQLKAQIAEPSGAFKDVTSQVEWQTSNLAPGSVSTSGIFTANEQGKTIITATLNDATGNLAISVGAPSVTALSLSPGGVSLAAGGLQQYAVSATYSNNTTGAVPGPITWTVSPASVATVSSSGLLSALAPGTFTVSASIGSMTATARGNIEAPSNTGAGTVNPYPISVYAGVNLSSFPTFKVSTYAASGSGTTINCTAIAGSKQLTCAGDIDFRPGQGIRVVGGGRSSAEAAITDQPLIYPQGNSTIGTHTYCYVVDTVDPLGGISEPSPQVCAVNQPDLALTTVYNNLGTTTSNVGPSPSFLWYASEDGGPFLLIDVAQFTSGASDMGQRIGSRGGWPNSLPAANPNISKQEDLFSTVQAVAGDQITLADPLLSPVTSSIVDHDDTQAVESAILAGVQAGGGTVVFGPGTFNLRRPAFTYVVNNSYAYPPYTTDLALDPWWGGFSYLYIPNGSAGNIDFEGAGRSTVLVTPPDHGGTAYLLSVGNEQREGAVGTPILKMEEVAKGSTQITLADKAEVSSLLPGDDIFIYSGTFGQTPDVDPTNVPDLHHYTELNTVASISGNVINLVYPTSKRYYDDGGSSWGLTKMPITPHNIELQHFNLQTFDTVVTPGDVIGELVNDVQINGTLSNGAFGGGYKRNVTIEHCQWAFGKGTAGWGQEDEYDEFTDLAFIENTITGYAAAGSEGPSGMAKIYATEGTSEVLFTGNTFDHVSLYADQTTEYFVQNNTFVDGIIAAGLAYAAHSGYAPLTQADQSFLSFDSQGAFSTDHNTFNITSDFSPPWVIRAGDFAHGNISDNVISFAGKMSPAFMIATFNGTVLNNTLTIQTPAVENIIVLVPDQSSETPMSTFVVQGNRTSAQIVAADILVTDSGFTDTNPVCIVNNTLQASQGTALYVAAADVNQACP